MADYASAFVTREDELMEQRAADHDRQMRDLNVVGTASSTPGPATRAFSTVTLYIRADAAGRMFFEPGPRHPHPQHRVYLPSTAKTGDVVEAPAGRYWRLHMGRPTMGR